MIDEVDANKRRLTRAEAVELLSRPQQDRVVLCAGQQVDRTLPDYRELD